MRHQPCTPPTATTLPCRSPPPTTPRSECLCPVVLTRGGDQLPVSTKFDMRSDPQVIRNYGARGRVGQLLAGGGVLRQAAGHLLGTCML